MKHLLLIISIFTNCAVYGQRKVFTEESSRKAHDEYFEYLDCELSTFRKGKAATHLQSARVSIDIALKTVNEKSLSEQVEIYHLKAEISYFSFLEDLERVKDSLTHAGYFRKMSPHDTRWFDEYLFVSFQHLFDACRYYHLANIKASENGDGSYSQTQDIADCERQISFALRQGELNSKRPRIAMLCHALVYRLTSYLETVKEIDYNKQPWKTNYDELYTAYIIARELKANDSAAAYGRLLYFSNYFPSFGTEFRNFCTEVQDYELLYSIDYKAYQNCGEASQVCKDSLMWNLVEYSLLTGNMRRSDSLASAYQVYYAPKSIRMFTAYWSIADRGDYKLYGSNKYNSKAPPNLERFEFLTDRAELYLDTAFSEQHGAPVYAFGVWYHIWKAEKYLEYQFTNRVYLSSISDNSSIIKAEDELKIAKKLVQQLKNIFKTEPADTKSMEDKINIFEVRNQQYKDERY